MLLIKFGADCQGIGSYWCSRGSQIKLTRQITFLLTDISTYFKHGIKVAATFLFQEEGEGNAVFAFLLSGMERPRSEKDYFFLAPWRHPKCNGGFGRRPITFKETV